MIYDTIYVYFIIIMHYLFAQIFKLSLHVVVCAVTKYFLFWFDLHRKVTIDDWQLIDQASSNLRHCAACAW